MIIIIGNTQGTATPTRYTDNTQCTTVETDPYTIERIHYDAEIVQAKDYEDLHEVFGVKHKRHHAPVKLPAKPFIPKKRGSRVTYLR